MNNQLSLRDNRRSQMPSSEDPSGIQGFRDTLALEYALSLSSSEADALAQDLSRLRDSKEGFSTVSYRLLRAVHARQRSNGGSSGLEEQIQPACLRVPSRTRFHSSRQTG
jgi:hypothetical protein